MIAAIYARIIVVVLFGFLASVTSASAECAWVLWSQSCRYKCQSDGWLLQTAYPTVAQCTQALDLREAEARRARWIIDRRASTDLFVMDPSRTTEVSGHASQCLPDTVDPRGPKGK